VSSFRYLFRYVDEIVIITAEAASRLTDENEGQISFEEFYTLLEEIDSVDATPVEGQDPKVAEFLRILEGLLSSIQFTFSIQTI
jgi:hypothetical protein